MNRALVVLLVSGIVLGCKKQNVAPPPPAVRAPTVQEADAFAKVFATHMVPCNNAALDREINSDLIVDRVLAGRSMSPADMAGYRRGVGSVGAKLCAHFTPGATYTYLRTQMIEGTPRPLFRLLMDGGFNYHSLELDKQGSEIRVADLYQYVTGERVSSTFGNLMDLALENGNAAGLNQQAIQTRGLMASKKFGEADVVFQSLPASVRNSKSGLLLAVEIAGGLDHDANYVAALEAYRKAFPDDPSLDLVMIDSAFARKKYDEMIDTIDRLDKRLGGDPYLETLRANAYAESGRLPEAIAHAKRATEQEPTLLDGWWTLFTDQVRGRDYPAAVVTLAVLRDRFHVATDDTKLRADPQFTGLTESPEYAELRKTAPVAVSTPR